jgi:hypothetical protein
VTAKKAARACAFPTGRLAAGQTRRVSPTRRLSLESGVPGPQVRALSLVPSPLFLHADGGGRQLVAAVGGSQSAGCSRRLFTEQAFFRPLPGLARVCGSRKLDGGACVETVVRAGSVLVDGLAHCEWRAARRRTSPPRRFFCQSTSPFTLSVWSRT